MNYQKILELQSCSGAKAKQAVIKKYKEDDYFKKFLFFALNPLVTYGVSEKTLKENMPKVSDSFDPRRKEWQNIFQCCSYLSSLRAVDNHTIIQICELLSTYCDEEANLYMKLLSKTVRLGVTAKTVNKVIRDLIPEWEVQQAYSVDKYPLKDGTEFWLTEKLNGNRATFYNGRLIARSGQPYTGLEHIEKELRFVAMSGFVTDGELTLLDKGELSDNEAFRVATGILNSDSEDKTKIAYTIFDIIPVSEFESNVFTLKYENRRKILDVLAGELTDENSHVRVLPALYHGNSIEVIDGFLDKMVDEDKEGLMINLNVPYKKTRHKGILKVKRFYTMDLEIVGVEEGSGRLSGTLGALVVNFNGNSVKVGTGVSDELRKVFWEHKEDIIGKICEVKYKETSYDKNTGLESLQFPVFVGIREDKDTVSYW